MSKTLVPKSFKANVDRALHNLYQEKSTTLHPLTAIPIYYRRLFKGDTVDFGVLESILRSEPTYSPLLSNWRLRFEWYFDSDANRYGWIDNNTRLAAEEVMTRKHHRYVTNCMTEVVSDKSDAIVIGRGSIADYSGIAPGYTFVYDPLEYDIDTNKNDEVFGTTFNVDFHLTYLNIIRNYHVNKQFTAIPYIANVNAGSSMLKIDKYELDDLDNLFIALRSCPNGVLFYNMVEAIAGENDAPSDLANYYESAFNKFAGYLACSEGAFGGLFCTQFEPDLYQNLLNGDSNLLRATIRINDDGFTIEEFRLQNHLQDLYDKIFVSGGTDRDLSRTIWGIDSNSKYDIPELLCVHSEIIGTNLVTSSTAAEINYGGEPLQNVPGSMAGNLNARRGAGRMQKFTAKTAGSLMCIVTLTPIVAYKQNIERHLLENNFMDEFNPSMARKGFENVPLSDYLALPLVSDDNQLNEVTDLSKSVGKQVAWLREMTAVNRVHGEFSNDGEKEDWVLTRDYIADTQYVQTANISPYGNPLDFQYPFVSTSLKDPNFHLQVAFKVQAVRPIGRRFMPNLGN